MRQLAISAIGCVLLLGACEEEVPVLRESDRRAIAACEAKIKEQWSTFMPTVEYRDVTDRNDKRFAAALHEYILYNKFRDTMLRVDELKKWDELTPERKRKIGTYLNCDTSSQLADVERSRKEAAAAAPPPNYVAEAAAEAERYANWIEQKKAKLKKEAKKHTFRTGPNTRIDVYEMKNGAEVTCVTTMYPSGPILKCDD